MIESTQTYLTTVGKVSAVKSIKQKDKDDNNARDNQPNISWNTWIFTSGGMETYIIDIAIEEIATTKNDVAIV